MVGHTAALGQFAQEIETDAFDSCPIRFLDLDEDIIAWLGAEKVRATAPVYIGDTVHVVATVTASRAAKDPGRGVVSLDYAVRNQKGEDVMLLSLTMLMRSREQ